MTAIDKIKEAFSKVRDYPDIKVKGYQLFEVGGHVRDSIMGIPSNDVDIATNATPTEIITLCKVFDLNFRYTKNSVAHGTIVVEGIEITTFRKEISWNGHNAVVVWSTNIEEDLSRRDLSINAVAKNLFTHEIVDPFNGIQDIKSKIIRAVGNAQNRLNEDPDRAQRAVRFANRFGFDIEYSLIEAIQNTDISIISIERTREEFMKILGTRKDRYIFLILDKVLPEFRVLKNLDGGDKHAETVDIHSLLTMKHMMSVSENPLLIFAALLHDIGKYYTKDDPERSFRKHETIGAKIVVEIMTHLKFSNEEKEYVEFIIQNHMRWHFLDHNFSSPTDKTLRRAIRDIPEKFNKEEIITDLLKLTWADCQANLLNKPESFESHNNRKGIYDRVIEILHKQPEVKISNLEINGNDLIEMGFKPSPIFNIILKDIEEKIFDEKLINNKDDIKKYIETNFGHERK